MNLPPLFLLKTPSYFLSIYVPNCLPFYSSLQDAMELMGVVGIMVNCILIGLSGQVHRMFPHMSTAQTILLIVVLECFPAQHAMIALKYGISYAIPDIPDWVATEMAKVEFQRREALRRLSTSNSPPTREDSQPPSPRHTYTQQKINEFNFPSFPKSSRVMIQDTNNNKEKKTVIFTPFISTPPPSLHLPVISTSPSLGPAPHPRPHASLPHASLVIPLNTTHRARCLHALTLLFQHCLCFPRSILTLHAHNTPKCALHPVSSAV
ncbi:Anoctamin-8 [Portunus trituberculatus]|uniref:Anoctamin n=1 Tax=Portunus trituberculatus TaxID=210409 RepID=A0A5B7GBN2_PORTR|nr:Anoctamin-8 [Portunus trituberculatus]